MNAQEWTPATLQRLNRSFENASPREILQWGLETFGRDLVMATGFGVSGIVLTHHLSRLSPQTTVFYLETDLHFEETYALRDQLTEQLGITFTPVHGGVSLEHQAREHGDALWTRNPDQCCFIRKVLPLRRFLADKKAWVTGIRRDQTVSRAGTGIVEWDRANGLVKLNPLAMWTEEEVWQYIQLNNLPYNTLLDEGYASIGCTPCTRSVAPGEDPRAGRWAGFTKTECGIHMQQHIAA